jgi:hypothetical protein
VAEAQQLFETHGAVLDVKLFPCLDQFRGASALVRMASIEAAERAISALNNSTPPGGMQSLIVRYAESAQEKSARLTRRERQQLLQRNGLGGDLNLGNLDPMQLQQAMAALGLGGRVGPGSAAAAAAAAASLMHASNGGLGASGTPIIPQQYQAAVQSSICVKGMPNTIDRLWLYENFARFGAISGMRILIDEQTGLCNGTAFINYGDPIAAQRARQAMSGMRAGERILHVVVQQQGAAGTNSGGVQSQNRQDGMMGGVPPGSDQIEWQNLIHSNGGGGNGMVW